MLIAPPSHPKNNFPYKRSRKNLISSGKDSTHRSPKRFDPPTQKGGFSGFPEKPFSSQEEKNNKWFGFDCIISIQNRFRN